jgi:hypothetical protein
MTDITTGVAPANSKGYPPEDLLKAIEDQWPARAKQMHPSPKSMAYKKAEVEFFVGAMVALTSMGYVMPVKWTINMMRGVPPSQE